MSFNNNFLIESCVRRYIIHTSIYIVLFIAHNDDVSTQNYKYQSNINP